MSSVNRKNGHAIEIVSMDRPDAPWVRNCPLPCHAMGPSILSYGYNRRFVPWLRKHRRDYDVVVVNGIWQYNAFGVWLALNDTATPYVVFTHGMLDPWFKRTYTLKHLKKWLYWPWGDYRTLRDAAAVLFTSEEERRLARQSFWLYKCDEMVVRYGTADPVGDPAGQKRIFLEKFPQLAGKRCILFLGRVHVKKGPDILFRAFADILRELPGELTRDLHLVMAGPNDHPYGQSMAQLADQLGLAERVTWTGMVIGDLKWGAFYAADAFILPSHQENFGIAVAEALACGVPVLISNKVNIWREIRMHRAGLIESDDLKGTRLIIEQWLRMAGSERDEMRVCAKACFTERFHIQQTADLFVRLLSTLELHGSKE